MTLLDFRKNGSHAYHDVEGVYGHISDPNERRRMALAEIDKAPLSWYHIRLVVVTGVGFFTDAYSLFAIGLVTAMMGMVYWQDPVNQGNMPNDAATLIKVAPNVGTVFGMIVFGYLADLVGRKKMYGIELMIIITATLAESLCSASPGVSVVGVIVFWRVIMGIGIGGDYPLSAVITSEMADTKWRGAMIGAVFAMQGFGQFASAMMVLIVTVGFKETLLAAKTVGNCDAACQRDVDIMWRLVLGFGGIPGWFALYYRLTIPETPRYTFDVKHNLEKAVADSQRFRSGRMGEGRVDEVHQAKVKSDMLTYHKSPPSVMEFIRYFRNWRHAIVIFGTAGSWFFLDVAFYGLNLNTPTILSLIGFADKANVYQLLYNSAVGQLVLISAGAIPGYWFTVALADIIGRKPIQMGGFLALTIIFAIIGFAFGNLSQGALLALYILAQFFFNFGPNATTFMVPGECFPTRLRATAHGISAAAGKIGAVIAQVAFTSLYTKDATPTHPHPWLDKLMQIFALFMLCGVFTSILIPETKRKTLEELAGESESNLAYELRFVERFWRPTSAEIREERRRYQKRSSFLGLPQKYFRFSE